LTSKDTEIFSRERANTSTASFDCFCGGRHGLGVAELLSYIADQLKPAYHCTTTMVQRLLAGPLFATGGRMHLSGFVWFNVMVVDKAGSSSSFSRWFSLLDLNGDGFLDRQDLKHFFDGKLEQVRPCYTLPRRPVSFSFRLSIGFRSCLVSVVYLPCL